ncbi:SGNH/GDSL hydrolase family protein [Patescibacteria group bacterium]|nr:SGNH/GDSL hydrolase family protein [Patescibacteria group bacterium]
MHKKIIRSGVLFLSVFAALALCEATLGIFGYKSKIINWRFTQGYVGAQQQLEMPYIADDRLIYRQNASITHGTYSTNPNGLRINPEHASADYTPGIPMLMLGDSFVYGEGVSDRSTYPYITEAILRKEGYPVSIYNGGIDGYGPDQEYIYLRDFLLSEYHPSIVVWNFNMNDIVDANEACLFKKKARGYVRLAAWRNTLFFPAFAIQHTPIWIRNTKLFTFLIDLPALIAGRERYTFGCTLPKNVPDELLDKTELDKISYLLSQIKILSEKNHFYLITTIVPFQYYFAPQTPNTEPIMEKYEKLKETLRSSGVPYLDASELIARTHQPTLFTYRISESKTAYSPTTSDVLGTSDENLADTIFLPDSFGFGWHHLNSRGNELFAEVIGEKLKTLLNAPEFLRVAQISAWGDFTTKRGPFKSFSPSTMPTKQASKND